jgi:hypothetical protein
MQVQADASRYESYQELSDPAGRASQRHVGMAETRCALPAADACASAHGRAWGAERLGASGAHGARAMSLEWDRRVALLDADTDAAAVDVLDNRNPANEAMVAKDDADSAANVPSHTPHVYATPSAYARSDLAPRTGAKSARARSQAYRRTRTRQSRRVRLAPAELRTLPRPRPRPHSSVGEGDTAKDADPVRQRVQATSRCCTSIVLTQACRRHMPRMERVIRCPHVSIARVSIGCGVAASH